MARDINDISLELNITAEYLNQFLNISSVSKNLELILELKEIIQQKNVDSLLFDVYTLNIQQYVMLGTKKEMRKIMADSLLAIALRMNDTNKLAMAYFNLGTSTDDQEAIDYYRKSLQYVNRISSKRFASSLYNNLSARYRFKGDFQQAINCADSGYIASKAVNRLEGMATARYRSAEAYFFMDEFEKTVKYAKDGMSIFKEANILRRQDQCAAVIAASYRQLGNYKEAFKYLELKNEIKDSLTKLTQSKEAEFIDQRFRYELEQKRDSSIIAQERVVSNLKIENINNKLSKRRMQNYFLFSGGFMVLLFAMYFWRSYRRKAADNLLIENQKALVEDKNKEIVDSITYAKRIQNAILPPSNFFKNHLPDSFVMYCPKDIVAGDFYWMEPIAPTSNKKEATILFAASDCTGHGVPGAMVSVVCNNALNRSVREYGITDPGKILDKTREIVIQEFEKSDEDVKDEMDIALCSLENNALKYAGAHNPLFIIRKDELIEIKANKQPIGKFDNPEPYITHEVQLQKKDTIYIFSDGFVDQFGGEKGKKFKTKAFK